MQRRDATSVRARLRAVDPQTQTARIRELHGKALTALDVVLEADRAATFLEQAVQHTPVPPEGLDERGRVAFILQTLARHLREGRHRDVARQRSMS